MPSPSKFLDTSGLTLYDQNIKDYIDDIIENDISPVIDAKAADTVFGPSGTGHSKGLVPDPGSTQGSTKFLREDSSWAVPALDPSSMTTVTGTVSLSGAAQANWTQTDSSADDYIKNKPSLATVATSGSYSDLSNKPSIPAAQVQSDWSVTNTSSKAYIKNKPTIPSVSTATSIADGVTGYTTGNQVYDYAENKANKSTTISSSSTDTQYPSALAVKTYVDAHGFDPSSMSTASGTVTMTNAENLSNKVTSLSSSSTDTQYPSAKCVYDLVGDIERALNALLGSNATTYTVTATWGMSGTGNTLEGAGTYNEGDTCTIILPDTQGGLSRESVVRDGQPITSQVQNEQYSFTVTADTTIRATYAPSGF